MAQLLTDQLRTMAAKFPDEIGYENVGDGTRLTFLEWEERSNRLARGFIERGVAKSDRVAVHLAAERVLDWVTVYAAVHKAGAVAVPVNTRLVPRELAYILEHAEAAAAVTTQDALPALPPLPLVVTDLDELSADDASEVQVPLDSGDLADIMYTSGTTGRPKGVAVRHRNVAMVPNNVPSWTGQGWLHGSPLFTFAGIGFIYNPMKMGMTGLFLPHFDAGRWLSIVAERRPGAAFLVPAMAQLLVAHPDFESADLSSLWLCSLGSAPLAPETLRRLQERMPQATVSNGYGMTEAGPAYCSMPKEEATRRIGSVGRPVPPVEFRIVDETGTALPAGEVGEVLIRMPGREREYYKDPEATARMWHDGWLHSGDLGRLDEDGYLYIVGRMKDVIIRGGNNVHAADVEAALYEHPAVREAAVAGVAHPVLGEDVGAWVVLRTGHNDVGPEDLRAFCAERLADYKVPRRITFVDALPRNATGKVLKAELPASLSP